MSRDLRDALLEIQGVGEATADKILDAVAQHSDGDDAEQYRRACRDALDKLEEGHPGHAEGYLRTALRD